jgi:glycosyltransferase involved in cell wall biosynthesis
MNLNRAFLHVLAQPAYGAVQRRIARSRQPATSPLDVVFVTPPANAPGWILEAICREVAQRLPGSRTRLVPLSKELPAADRYFFSHFMFFFDALRNLSPVHLARSYVFATHLEAEKHGIPDDLVAKLLKRATGIACMNNALLENFARRGVPRDKLFTLIGAASRHEFQPHRRTADGLVGFSSAYYPRKSPHLLLEIVRSMPHRRFVLLGRGWTEYGRFSELVALPNFEYVEPRYSEYPAHYSRMSVFVSVSQKEGGPIPLIEAMMSNVVPVASLTGFAPDVIRPGTNGFLFPVDARAPDICALIDAAFGLGADIRATVEHCDWDPYSERLARAMELPRAAHQE